MISKKENSPATIVDIFSKKKEKKAETILNDLKTIEHIIDLAFKGLYHYKHYTVAAEVMFVMQENLQIISAHKKKYQDLLKKEE